MILHTPAASGRVAPLAERLLRDVFDAGLCLGHSVRTPEQACRLACGEPMICTSLVESRLLGRQRAAVRPLSAAVPPPGASPRPLAHGRHRRRPRWRSGIRYGETVFLLEPNIKRSRGALRDIQLIRWIGSSATARPIPASCTRWARCGDEDLDALLRASEFLLRLRNELHFHAGHGGRRAGSGRATPHRRAARLRGQARTAAGGTVHARLFPPHRRR